MAVSGIRVAACIACARLTPPITCTVDLQDSRGKKIIRVLVPRGEDTPYAIEDNKIFVREEAETSLAVRDEIVQLVLRGKTAARALPARIPMFWKSSGVTGHTSLVARLGLSEPTATTLVLGGLIPPEKIAIVVGAPPVIASMVPTAASTRVVRHWASDSVSFELARPVNASTASLTRGDGT